MCHLCHASSAYIVVTVTQTRESATAGLQLPMAHVQHSLLTWAASQAQGAVNPSCAMAAATLTCASPFVSRSAAMSAVGT
jgi:hypothetical protein